MHGGIKANRNAASPRALRDAPARGEGEGVTSEEQAPEGEIRLAARYL